MFFQDWNYYLDIVSIVIVYIVYIPHFQGMYCIDFPLVYTVQYKWVAVPMSDNYWSTSSHSSYYISITHVIVHKGQQKLEFSMQYTANRNQDMSHSYGMNLECAFVNHALILMWQIAYTLQIEVAIYYSNEMNNYSVIWCNIMSWHSSGTEVQMIGKALNWRDFEIGKISQSNMLILFYHPFFLFQSQCCIYIHVKGEHFHRHLLLVQPFPFGDKIISNSNFKL